MKFFLLVIFYSSLGFANAIEPKLQISEAPKEQNILLVDYSANPKDIPNSKAIQRWAEKPGYVSNSLDLNKLVKISLNCEDKKLYPTHADQTTKAYHVFNAGIFDARLLKGSDKACLRPSLYRNGSGVYYCVRADHIETAVISDTYKDSCGNYYRGFWRVTYMHADESMGTLFAKGRTMYVRPGAEFKGDYVLGGTYPVDEKEFLFLSPLFLTDQEKIDSQFFANQTSKIRYNDKTLLFEEVPEAK
jgi:hypothetical protein